MAQVRPRANIKKLLTKSVQQDEFHVVTEKVLRELLDPEEVEPNDKWEFVNGGGTHLIIVRKREVIQRHENATFDDPPPPPEEPVEETPVDPPVEELPVEVPPEKEPTDALSQTRRVRRQ